MAARPLQAVGDEPLEAVGERRRLGLVGGHQPVEVHEEEARQEELRLPPRGGVERRRQGPFWSSTFSPRAMPRSTSFSIRSICSFVTLLKSEGRDR